MTRSVEDSLDAKSRPISKMLSLTIPSTPADGAAEFDGTETLVDGAMLTMLVRLISSSTYMSSGALLLVDAAFALFVQRLFGLAALAVTGFGTVVSSAIGTTSISGLGGGGEPACDWGGDAYSFDAAFDAEYDAAFAPPVNAANDASCCASIICDCASCAYNAAVGNAGNPNPKDGIKPSIPANAGGNVYDIDAPAICVSPR